MNEKLYKKSGMLALLLVMLASTLFAQDRTVTGVVKDSGGNSLPGVNVVLKGTSTGATTDADGKFSVSAGSDAVLVFSFIGFATQEIQVGSQTTIDVVLAEDATTLDEIVVIGYGERKKALVTGANLHQDGAKLQSLNTASAMESLQGIAPGVSISRNSGQPGAGTKVRIRGIGTIENSKSALHCGWCTGWK
jgi:TonB-dependent starch-binding outer membrane protein SusC